MEFFVIALPIAISTVGALLVLMALTRTSITYNESLSHHIAQTKQTIVWGAALLTLASVLLWAWALMIDVSWFTRAALMAVGASYVVTGLVPYGVSKRRDMVHDVAALCGQGTMIVASILLAYESDDPARIAAWIAALLQIGVTVVFIATKPGRRHFMLVGQLASLAAFLIVIIMVGALHA